jgi:hypothetical protein
MNRFYSSLMFVAFLLLSISILSNAHGQEVNDSLAQQQHDSLQADTMAKLEAAVDMYRHQVDSLQCLPNMPVKEFYTVAKNLALARSDLLLYVAQTDPNKAQLAIATARLYQQRAVAFNDKAVRER